MEFWNLNNELKVFTSWMRRWMRRWMLCVKIYSRNKCFATTSASQITLNLHFLEFQDFHLRACGQQVLNFEMFWKTSRLLNPYLWNSRISSSFWIICGTHVREYCKKNNVRVRNVSWVVWRRNRGCYRMHKMTLFRRPITGTHIIVIFLLSIRLPICFFRLAWGVQDTWTAGSQMSHIPVWYWPEARCQGYS